MRRTASGRERNKSWKHSVDAATRNRYRLRFREAVRDPSAPVAVAPFGQDDGFLLARFGRDGKIVALLWFDQGDESLIGDCATVLVYFFEPFC